MTTSCKTTSCMLTASEDTLQGKGGYATKSANAMPRTKADASAPYPARMFISAARRPRPLPPQICAGGSAPKDNFGCTIVWLGRATSEAPYFGGGGGAHGGAIDKWRRLSMRSAPSKSRAMTGSMHSVARAVTYARGAALHTAPLTRQCEGHKRGGALLQRRDATIA